jgi:hypothetical protein
VRGGSGWRQFRRRRGQSWTGSARGVRGGGEEAIGRENPSEEERRRVGVAWRKKRQSSRGEGGSIGFVAAHGL